MRTIAIVDTSILLNVLNVPGHNQNHRDVIQQLARFTENRFNLLLPIASIIETGNHIAKLPEGRHRRTYAEVFVKQVRQALRGKAPWQPIQPPTVEIIDAWLDDFPEHAMRRISIADFSIIQQWKMKCGQHPHDRVFIWAADDDLSGYDRVP
ncbi:MAG: hypothetical protein GVY13_05945 [Alphaproteobacteria bacterium]|jgi:hypothetical protein|nr:hypothetical protein [Alphaproteobacteria bacterium]